ncbi:Glycosyl hydrolases family 2, sugar binding domain [Georgenia satyanarayanai]|uniref:Glycosyl hydrolases family 2, sugar binding domain n=1 Tax=Georgenia satyanarayanai TaxID=860221 RepID=A0A2Y9C4Q2_9MICO|nr:LamG-like jellyroll fold domain-containing protein [Georgenia satyanarayanai]PYG00594.1 glycosyl hydrolase family 2 [Georgenia satyanarayanai]SSA39983.1 Glycosyl hydrolases family 2, sugar binding domain [Georgenia satyanarayanai]
MNGLRGEYFAGVTAPDFELTEPTSTILDGELNFNNLVPVYEQRTGQGEHTGARWTGQIEAPSSGDYTFYVSGDNGFRLWVDGEQIIDWWVNQWDIEQTSQTVTLEAGEKYDFRLDQFQATGGANLFVRWTGPGIEKSIVPLSAFTPPDDFDVYPARGTVNEAGDAVRLELDGAVAAGSDVADHVVLTVDGGEIPVAEAEVYSSGEALVLTPEGPVTELAVVRLAYDGEGDLTVGGEDAPAFDIPVENLSTYVMVTPWAADLDRDNPLPEYPRPGMVREDWQNLNGPWQLEILEADSETPFEAEAFSKEVVVPFPIESILSEVELTEDHFAYYRTFAVPEGWAIGTTERLQLNFDAVDYEATVYVNGTEVAHHLGGFDAFSADITDALVEGENELVVRVTDTTGDQPRGKQSNNPGGIFYTPASGIWQTVWMEPVPAAHITQLDLTPDLDNDALTVNVNTAGASDEASVEIVAYDADGVEVGSVTGATDTNLQLEIPDPHLWSPEDPYLYDLTATLTDGDQNDAVDGYSGMRSIEVAEVDGQQRILLNGEQTYLNSTLDQGYWPDGVYTAPTDEALAWDIQETKDLGFNTIRKHIKVEPQRWYYHADQIGMLVWQDMPSGDNANEDVREQYRAEMRTMVEQFGSSTSIIGWVPFNEGWGEWNLQTTGEIANEIKALDPSRLMNAHSGHNCCNSLGDSGQGDIIDYHQYTGPALPRPDDTRAAIDGEHGGFSLSVPGHVWPGGSVNPYGEVDTSEELTAAYVQNTAELIAPAQDYLSGSVYTQLTDLEGEVNGFWTYDRKVSKMDRDAVRAINQKLVEVGSHPRTFPEPTDDALAYWPLNENEGDTAEDVTGNDHTLTLGEGMSWEEIGIQGSALGLDGDGAATTQVPELDTTGNFSVSAWVRLDELPTGGYATVASMDGVRGKSAFFLQYGAPINGFAFSFENDRAVAEGTPRTGEWRHLVGVRDAVARELRLYLDGELAAVQESKASTLTDGTFAVGRGQWEGNDVDFLDGAVDNVHLFDRVLTAEQVAELAVPPAELVEVTPEGVTFSDEHGTDDDTFTVPDVEGVEYRIGDSVVEAGTHEGSGEVTVTAHALEGFVLAEGAVAEWSHTFSTEGGGPELVEVTPEAVSFVDRPGFADDTFTVPALDGVEYVIDGDVIEAGTYPGVGTVTVTVRALEGFVLAEGAAAEWSFAFTTGTPAPDTRGAEFHLSNTWRGSTDVHFMYGRWADEVLIGDWDGDGVDTIAVRRGNEFHVSNAQRGGDADVVLTYGRDGDVILVGDWDGNGTDTFAVRRGAEYHVKNSLRGGDADVVFTYGRETDQVLVGDWNADGTDTFAVRRGAVYHVKNSLRGGDADTVFTYGRSADVTLAGDWDGNGSDTFAIQRGRVYHVNNSLRGGDADTVVTFGRLGDEVYVGDWDGNGTDTLGVRRPVGPAPAATGTAAAKDVAGVAKLS